MSQAREGVCNFHMEEKDMAVGRVEPRRACLENSSFARIFSASMLYNCRQDHLEPRGGQKWFISIFIYCIWFIKYTFAHLHYFYLLSPFCCDVFQPSPVSLQVLHTSCIWEVLHHTSPNTLFSTKHHIDIIKIIVNYVDMGTISQKMYKAIKSGCLV